jgi:zinc and cadmium transporter
MSRQACGEQGVLIDPVLVWIVMTGIVMSAIALVGSLTLVLSAATLERIQLPLVAVAAGSLMGGAFFHLLPSAMATDQPPKWIWTAVAAGFAAFFLLEQLLHRHHRRHSSRQREPFTYLILLGDGLHNLLDGLAIASAFVVDVRLGLTAWLAAALHEVPQELGDFAVLVHGGWPKRRALLFNLLSGLMFLLGGLITYLFSRAIDTALLVPFAAGTFLYIGASDLMPELTRHGQGRDDLLHMLCFGAGLVILWVPMMLGV